MGASPVENGAKMGLLVTVNSVAGVLDMPLRLVTIKSLKMKNFKVMSTTTKN